jgi:uncharacterized protein YjbI with pentapeptide repeats
LRGLARHGLTKVASLTIIIKRERGEMKFAICHQELIAILECGVEGWNSFRRGHPERVVLLYGASLQGAQLAHADLHRTILMESDLRRANLTSANLERAVLRKTDFQGANLRSANIDGADLFRADLSDADLRDASCVSCFLKRTDLRGADLSTARGLTAAQVSDAFGDERTRLPVDVARPAGWVAA